MWIFTKTTYRCGDVSTSDAFNRRIEVVKCLALDNLGTDLAANTEGRESTFNNNQAEYIDEI